MRTSAKKPAAAAGRSTSTSRAGKAGAAKAAPPSIDEKDDYIVNLKGQLYLLTIENEMLKKSTAAEARDAARLGASGVGAASFAGMSSFSAATPMGGFASPASAAAGRSISAAPPGVPGALSSSALLTSALPSAEYPTEISDAFEIMRQKYSQLEHKYQHDLEESRRGAEALASQCAAQSSLIATLKKEVAAGKQVLEDQKALVQRVEQKSASDMDRAQRDIAHLHARIVELNEDKRAQAAHIAEVGQELADAHATEAAAVQEARAAEGARLAVLDSYARQLIASRALLRAWKLERRLRLGALDDRKKAYAERNASEARAVRAEKDAVAARAEQAAAAAVFDRALAEAAEERAALRATIESLQGELTATRIELDNTTGTLATVEAAVPGLHRQLDALQSGLGKAQAHREAALKHSNELERLLVAQKEESDSLRSTTVAAEERLGSTREQLRGTEDQLAAALGRVQALETTEVSNSKSIATLGAELEALGQAHATLEREASTLRDELSRRPPIDVIRELDVENLLQRNVQVAAAMNQLLAWQQAHQSQPLVAGLQPPPADVE